MMEYYSWNYFLHAFNPFYCVNNNNNNNMLTTQDISKDRIKLMSTITWNDPIRKGILSLLET